MDTLLSRFIVNLPSSELQDTRRLFYHVEKMWWFAIDQKESQASFRDFSYSALQQLTGSAVSVSQFEEMFADFAAYKKSIPVAGCALINQDSQHILMIRPVNC